MAPVHFDCRQLWLILRDVAAEPPTDLSGYRRKLRLIFCVFRDFVFTKPGLRLDGWQLGKMPAAVTTSCW